MTSNSFQWYWYQWTNSQQEVQQARKVFQNVTNATILVEYWKWFEIHMEHCAWCKSNREAVTVKAAQSIQGWLTERPSFAILNAPSEKIHRSLRVWWWTWKVQSETHRLFHASGQNKGKVARFSLLSMHFYLYNINSYYQGSFFLR